MHHHHLFQVFLQLQQVANTINLLCPFLHKFFCPGLVYTYLAGHVGCNTSNVGAFRALKQGYISWASGRLERMEVNMNRPNYCHIRTGVKASMRNATYSVYLLVHSTDYQVSVERATCPCAAGLVSQYPCVATS